MLGADVLVENYYNYDHNGNRTAKRQIGGVTQYTYDALNQLTKAEYPAYTEQLYYDRAGNRKRRVAKGIEELYQYDEGNRLTEYTKGGIKTKFTYDKVGNLLTDDKSQYTYDAFNRTKRVDNYFSIHTQRNYYDAEGLCNKMIEDVKLVQFIFRGDEVVAEEKDSNIVRFIRGYGLVASDAEKAKTYYHYACDEMGSNARRGWVYRVEVKWKGKGKTYFMDGTGNYHSENATNPKSTEFYDPKIANDAHIPVHLEERR